MKHISIRVGLRLNIIQVGNDIIRVFYVPYSKCLLTSLSMSWLIVVRTIAFERLLILTAVQKIPNQATVIVKFFFLMSDTHYALLSDLFFAAAKVFL